jgi:hypothetical protein
MIAWFSRVVIQGQPTIFLWWLAHAVALLVVVWFTLIRHGMIPWLWILGGALAVSNAAGQTVLKHVAGTRRPG